MTELDLSNQNLTTLDSIPDDITYLDCSNNSLEKLPELPKSLEWLICNNNKLKELPKLPKNFKGLICNNNKLKELPKLPKSLEWLNCSNNLLKELPKLPVTTIYLDCSNNLLKELPKLPKYLSGLNAQNNLLTEIPKINKKSMMRIERNPISKNLYKVYSLNINNIFVRNNQYYLTLRKGMVLFHNTPTYESYNDMYLGYKVNDHYNLYPDHQTYFFLHPFCNTYGNITTINVLQKDINVFLGISPSDLNKQDIRKRYYKNCNAIDYKLQKYTRYECLKEEERKNNIDIFGWITLDTSINGAEVFHGENSNFLKYHDYVSYYKNINDVIDRPEIQLYPRKIKSYQHIDIKTEDPVKYIEDNINDFNYKTIAMVNNSNFKEYKSYVDSLLSDKGLITSTGTYRMKKDEIDGIYYLV